MAVLGHPEIGNPKSMRQLDATHPLEPCLIGICKDMMSSMDPLREAGLQDEVAGTSLVTRKFSSSISGWKAYAKFRRARVRIPYAIHGFRLLVLLLRPLIHLL